MNILKDGSIIYKLIREQIQNFTPVAVPYFDKLGWTTYNDEPIYVAGNRIITSSGILNSNEFKVIQELQTLNLNSIPKLKSINPAIIFWIC